MDIMLIDRSSPLSHPYIFSADSSHNISGGEPRGTEEEHRPEPEDQAVLRRECLQAQQGAVQSDPPDGPPLRRLLLGPGTQGQEDGEQNSSK